MYEIDDEEFDEDSGKNNQNKKNHTVETELLE